MIIQTIYFHSSECKNCVVQKSVWARIIEGYPKHSFILANINSDLTLVDRHKPEDAPEFVFIINGQEEARLKGFQQRQDLEEILDKLLTKNL